MIYIAGVCDSDDFIVLIRIAHEIYSTPGGRIYWNESAEFYGLLAPYRREKRLIRILEEYLENTIQK